MQQMTLELNSDTNELPSLTLEPVNEQHTVFFTMLALLQNANVLSESYAAW